MRKVRSGQILFPIAFPTLASLFVSSTPILRAEWREDVGFPRLQIVAGDELPTVLTDGATLVEALEGGNFAPNTTSPNFAGKTFNVLGNSPGTSSHATSVAGNFFGNTTSLLPGAFPVDCYYAWDWMIGGLLKFGQSVEPLFETRSVQNHSWIMPAGGMSVPDAEQINRRLDYAIDRDGFSCVVGVNFGNSTTLPDLLSQGYNTLSVGLTSGNHSAGFTALDSPGRIKPDIVAPHPNFTSISTPMVASAAGLMHEGLARPPHSLAGADLPRVTKALLLATATKVQFPNWSNTPARPLDLRYGAGQLNVHHAWLALRAGNFPASGEAQHPSRGWAAETIPANGSSTWFFTLPTGDLPTPFCAALTWHRVVEDGPGPGWGNLQVSLADLNLRLHHATEFTIGDPVAESTSTVDNVELVNQPLLPAGTYALVVENTSATATRAALAWHSLPAVTVEATDDTAEEIGDAPSPAAVTFTRSGDTSLPLLVPITTGGTAISGTDFEALPNTVTIPAGSPTATLPIVPISDSLDQDSRTLTIAAAADFALVRDPGQAATITLEENPYEAWRIANFDTAELANPEISSATDDPDGDTLPNLIEYALGLSPKTWDANPITVSTIDGHLQLTATKNPAATDITWSAETSWDLETWAPANIDTDTPGAFAASDTNQIEQAEKKFIRLKVTR